MALTQLEEERHIPKEKIIDAIEQALAAAYKKDYGKRGQVIRAHFNLETGDTEFSQIKKVVDETTAWFPEETETAEASDHEETRDDGRVRFNPEAHIMLEDAKVVKGNVALGDEVVFDLETQEDFGRIAAQTAKQVIIQRIREAERESIVGEFGGRSGEIISGIVSRIERGMVFIDFNRAVGVLPPEEQIPGEHYRRGERLKAYLYHVEETPRGVTLRLSRTHPRFIEKLLAQESPEVASGVVEVRSIAREAGSRSKVAVFSTDEHVEPVGSCVGQRGVRITTVMNELGGEKIDIIEWSPDAHTYVAKALSPSKVIDVTVNEEEHKAFVEVADDQLSLAIGKGGQNVRLAAKLTGWRIDIKGVSADAITSSDGESVTLEGEGDDFTPLKELKEALKEMHADDSKEEKVEDESGSENS